MKEKVLQYLAKDKTVQTKEISINKNNDQITINCMNIESDCFVENFSTRRVTVFQQ